MLELRKTQIKLFKLITDPGGARQTSPLWKGNLFVYAEAYFFRIAEALQNDFPVLFAILGSDLFYSVVVHYLIHFPSKTYDLSRVGTCLPEFLKNFSATQNVKCVSDLAKLELLLMESFHSAEIKKSQTVATEKQFSRRYFILDPSVRWIKSSFQLEKIYAQRKVFGRTANFNTYVIFRDRNGCARFEKLHLHQVKMLKLIAEKKNIERICSHLSKVRGLSEEKVSNWISDWLKQGITHLQ